MPMKQDVEILSFQGRDVGDKDVYNPTGPFKNNSDIYLIARVESRESETDSQSVFFRRQNNLWVQETDLPVLPLQDPFFTRIHDEFVFGGVRFPVENDSWRTEFYKGKDIFSLKKFAEGPLGMKDVRLIELHDGTIGVFTRPQGEIGGLGQIGFMKMNNLEDLNRLDLFSATLLENQFRPGQWGGVNETHLLKENKIGVLGHVAHTTLDNDGQILKHYYPMAFVFDYHNGKFTEYEILATRKDFPSGEAKRFPELDDVVYSGGIRWDNPEFADLYVGLSDVQCARIRIKNPFKSYLS